MRGLRYLAAAAAITGLLTGSAVTTASAATSQGAAARAAAGVHLRGGTTAVTTAPGVVAALLRHGIVPRAILPTSPPGLAVAQWCSVSPGSRSSTRAVKPGTSLVPGR